MRHLAIIPAYNEEKSVAAVMQKIREHAAGMDILVVNDGSSDGTSDKARNAGATVLDLPFNLGIGGAMQTGYIYAFREGYDVAVQVDGDGQHDPSYISALVAPVVEGRAHMAIGSRFVRQSGYKTPLGRKSGMLFFSALVRILTGLYIKDTTSGFRAVGRDVMEYFSLHYPSDYPEVDVLVKLYKKKFRITEVPVAMNIRRSGRSSITPLRSVYYMVKVSLSLLVGMLGKKE